MNDITFIIPTYNPDLKELKKSVNSALEVNGAQIIFVDDCSTDQSHFDYLKELDKLPNVTLYLNEVNRGAFGNGIYSYTLPTTKGVKKLDPDDEINPEAYNKIEIKDDSGIYLTGYKYKSHKMNRKLHKDIGHIFNGSGIYNAELAKKASLKVIEDKPGFKNGFEDQLIPYMLLLDNNKINVDETIFYHYKELATSTPKYFKSKYDIGMNDYSTMVNYLNEEFNMNDIKFDNSRKLFKRNFGKQMIFANLLALNVSGEDLFHDQLYKSAYKSLPKGFRKLIAYITVKF